MKRSPVPDVGVYFWAAFLHHIKMNFACRLDPLGFSWARVVVFMEIPRLSELPRDAWRSPESLRLSILDPEDF